MTASTAMDIDIASSGVVKPEAAGGGLAGFWRRLLAVVLAAALVACAGGAPVSETAQATADAAAQPSGPTIDHLQPPRDSTGGTPSRFEWTAIEGADHYAIGVWNETDTLVWRLNDVRGTSVDWPAGTTLDFGTYYWSVAAFRGDTGLAASGLAAFVVVR